MKEIWKASSDPSDWGNKKVSSLLPWWWFFWISSCILGQLSFRLALSAKEIHQLLAANVVTNLASFVEIPTALILVSIVRSVTILQETARRASAEAPATTPRIPGLAGAPFATRVWR
jgi:hypothetical protein